MNSKKTMNKMMRISHQANKDGINHNSLTNSKSRSNKNKTLFKYLNKNNKSNLKNGALKLTLILMKIPTQTSIIQINLKQIIHLFNYNPIHKKLLTNNKILIKFKILLKAKFPINKLTLIGKNYNKFYSEYKN